MTARTFFCRGCGQEQPAEIDGPHIGTPVGWYSLVRQIGVGQKAQRLGLYCQLACISIQLPRMQATAEDLGDAWLSRAREGGLR